jgi:processive 1,2-diacylglycerol beta-glucosyltransferase
MAEYKRLFDPALPVVGIVTDFVVHPFWIYRNVDAYAVASQEMRSNLIARGIRPERIVVSGIPVDARFSRPRLTKEALRAALDLPADRRVVLMMGGGLGIGPIELMMRALGDVAEPVAGVIIVGRNDRLARRIVAAAEHTEYPLRVLGFVDNVFDYMQASDVLVSKPGGLTSSEALAAELPMILVRPLPGQEERNTRYLVSRRAAVRAAGRPQLTRALEDLLGSPQRERLLRERMRALRRPDAAVAVAERILEVASAAL